VGGNLNFQQSFGGTDFFISKFNENGTLDYIEQFGTKQDDEATSLFELPNEETMSVGNSGDDIFISLHDSQLNQYSFNKFGTPFKDKVKKSLKLPDGSIAIIGTTFGDFKSGKSDIQRDQEQFFILKYEKSAEAAKCMCEEGFFLSGNECLPYEQLCENKECGNGVCDINNGEAVCLCDDGFIYDGNECIPRECKGVTCSNHGECRVANDAEMCVCDNGYQANGLECVKATSCDNISCGLEGACKKVPFDIEFIPRTNLIMNQKVRYYNGEIVAKYEFGELFEQIEGSFIYEYLLKLEFTINNKVVWSKIIDRIKSPIYYADFGQYFRSIDAFANNKPSHPAIIINNGGNIVVTTKEYHHHQDLTRTDSARKFFYENDSIINIIGDSSHYAKEIVVSSSGEILSRKSISPNQNDSKNTIANVNGERFVNYVKDGRSFLIKYGSDGKELWRVLCFARYIDVDIDSNIHVHGKRTDYWKISPSGVVLEYKELGAMPTNVHAFAYVNDTIYVLRSDTLQKFDIDGNLIWSKQYQSSIEFADVDVDTITGAKRKPSGTLDLFGFIKDNNSDLYLIAGKESDFSKDVSILKVHEDGTVTVAENADLFMNKSKVTLKDAVSSTVYLSTSSGEKSIDLKSDMTIDFQSVTCECESGYYNDNFECKPADKCNLLSIPGSSCKLNQSGDPVYSCRDGYVAEISGCYKENECADYNCGENGRCILNNNSPECSCDEGFYDANGTCMENESCDGVDCGLGDCVDSTGKAMCMCVDGAEVKDGKYLLQELY